MTRWKLIGPVPWDESDDIDRAFIGEPDIDTAESCEVAGKIIKWQDYITEDPDGKIDLTKVYGSLANVAVYAYAEVTLPKDRNLMLKVGSNDGFKCFLNGKEVGRFDGGRAYAPDQDELKVNGKKGVNKILLKITQMGAAWAFSARLTDLENAPIDLTHADD